MGVLPVSETNSYADQTLAANHFCSFGSDFGRSESEGLFKVAPAGSFSLAFRKAKKNILFL